MTKIISPICNIVCKDNFNQLSIVFLCITWQQSAKSVEIFESHAVILWKQVKLKFKKKHYRKKEKQRIDWMPLFTNDFGLKCARKNNKNRHDIFCGGKFICNPMLVIFHALNYMPWLLNSEKSDKSRETSTR